MNLQMVSRYYLILGWFILLLSKENSMVIDLAIRYMKCVLTHAEILLIEPPGTSFSETLIEIHTISFKKMQLKMLSAKWRPFCLGHIT